MKKIFSFICAAMLALSVSAQQKGESIALAIIPSDLPQDFPASAQTQVMNKLNQVLTANGVAKIPGFSQFFITVIAAPVTKDITPTAPPQVAQTLEFTFYIADYNTQTIFSQTTVTAKGIGPNEAKSYMDAIKHIQINSPAIKDFVAKGKAKIIDWYDSQAESIFMKAEQLAKRHEYEEALYLVSGFPTECQNFAKSIEIGNKIFQDYIDYTCQINLAKARAAWAAEQNSYGASQAGEYLSEIYPEASCHGEAMALYNEIKAKVLDDWKFEMKMYQDQIDLESQRIDAWKAVGVAYGNHQQPTTTNIAWLR